MAGKRKLPQSRKQANELAVKMVKAALADGGAIDNFYGRVAEAMKNLDKDIRRIKSKE